MEDLPVGFRFYPTEEELVSFYLHNKLEATREDLNRVMDRLIPVLEIYEYNPWDLPKIYGELCRRDTEELFFFMERQESEARGGRPNRLTTTGYWKATGTPSKVYSSDNRVIGVKRTMVFYIGRAPTGRKTDWKMNEYKAIEGDACSSSLTTSATSPRLRDELSVCRVYKKSKCLRAFDRRPRMKEARNPTIQQAHVEKDQAAISNGNPAPVGENRISSSPESSSSGEHSQLLQVQTEEISSMAVDNEASWYWDDLLNLL